MLPEDWESDGGIQPQSHLTCPGGGTSAPPLGVTLQWVSPAGNGLWVVRTLTQAPHPLQRQPKDNVGSPVWPLRFGCSQEPPAEALRLEPWGADLDCAGQQAGRWALLSSRCGNLALPGTAGSGAPVPGGVCGTVTPQQLSYFCSPGVP